MILGGRVGIDRKKAAVKRSLSVKLKTVMIDRKTPKIE
jgi:hypothetical protein